MVQEPVKSSPTSAAKAADRAASKSVPAATAPRSALAARLITGLTMLVVLLQGALSLDFASKASVTHDEYWHLPVGVLHWKTGRFDWDVLNPPLLRAWAAIPVARSWTTPPPPDPIPPGEYGDRFVQDHSQNFRELYFRGRVMVIVLSLFASSILIVWSRSLFGPLGGLIVGIIWCLSPNTIAHGSLVTTDMAAVLGFASVLWLMQRFADRPSWRNATAWGLALGLSQGLKYTCVLLYPICLVGWFLAARTSNEPRLKRLVVLGRFTAGMLLSLVVLKLVYLDLSVPERIDTWKFRSQAATRLQERLKPVGWLPIPFPKDFIRGIDEQRVVMEQPHPVYLESEWRETGFRSYYVKTLLYKLPLGSLLLLAIAAIPWRGLRMGGEGWPIVYVLLPAIGLVVLASLENMQLGLRYILPAIALAALFQGRTALRWRARGGRLFKLMVSVAALGSIFGLRYHPSDIAYFNEYAGFTAAKLSPVMTPNLGPDYSVAPVGGRLLLADSNIDWGQDLDGLKRYLAESGIDEIGLAYFGTVDPGAVGIRFHLPPARYPEPGRYAVSVNYVVGRPHVARDGNGGVQAINIEEFGYFRFFRPVQTIGYSIDVYDLTEADVLRWEAALERLRRDSQFPAAQ